MSSGGATVTAGGVLEGVVRTALDLAPAAPVELEEVEAFSNFNYVYRVRAGGDSFYLKQVAEKPKHFDVRLPRERIFSEAEAMRRFQELAGDAVRVPRLLGLDREAYAFVMSDVGAGRRVLLDVVGQCFERLAEQAEALGTALGRVHRASRGMAPLRPAAEREVIVRTIWDGLLAPGGRAVFPDAWAATEERLSRSECLVHADLWAKNLLVAAGEPVALVDFEGAHLGDPAFDLGTLLAVALLPALERPELFAAAQGFARRLFDSHAAAAGDVRWADGVRERAFLATAVFLAARGFGPFAYPMAETARQRVRALAARLVEAPVKDLDGLTIRVAAVLALPGI
ncbi:MAG: phosphotransferase [Acidobacteriota bacterium]